MKQLKDFNKTSELVKYISKTISNNKRSQAGTLWEQFSIEYFEQHEGIATVLDLNKTEDSRLHLIKYFIDD